MHRVRLTVAGAVGILVLAACGGTPSDDAADEGADRDPGAATSSPTAPTPTPTGSPTRTPTAQPEPAPHPVSLPALFEREYDGRDLRLGDVRFETDAYTSYSVSYRSGRLRVSGILNVPHGRGPFPALVLAHGYIDPDVYVNGQGMRREQDWLARAGYVVLHTDYRGHGFSDAAPNAERRLRLGYTVDVVNAVHALRATRRVPVDDDRIGLVGRSMGGGVIYNALVAQPNLVDAAVVFAPVSSLTADNFNRWTRDDPGRSEVSDHILTEYGEPRDAPGFWASVSPRSYFDRVTAPVLIHHGTADESCPIRWSRETRRAMAAAGVDVRLRVYDGEPHAFIDQFPLSMGRTVRFLDERLRAG
jgi:dipeptidyl aminopeptidase/acylaminoacyl peptidase